MSKSKFGYCMTTQTLNIALCKRDGIMDGQTDDLIPRYPRQTFQAEGIKQKMKWIELIKADTHVKFERLITSFTTMDLNTNLHFTLESEMLKVKDKSHNG